MKCGVEILVIGPGQRYLALLQGKNNKKFEAPNPKQSQMIKIRMTQTTAGIQKVFGFLALGPCFGHLKIRILNLFRISIFEFRI